MGVDSHWLRTFTVSSSDELARACLPPKAKLNQPAVEPAVPHALRRTACPAEQ